MNNLGILFIISAPSGTGKSSLIKAFLKEKKFFKIKRSISFTTRKIRPNEINGIDYHFISKKKFIKMIKKKEFLEYAKVFNNYYGTSLKNTLSILSNKEDLLLDIDWQGAKKIKEQDLFSKSIFLLPPSKKELFNRLKKRNQDNKNVILKRMKKFSEEVSHYLEYDYLIINKDFDVSISHLKSIVFSFKLSINNQKIRYKNLINDLLKK